MRKKLLQLVILVSLVFVIAALYRENLLLRDQLSMLDAAPAEQ